MKVHLNLISIHVRRRPSAISEISLFSHFVFFRLEQSIVKLTKRRSAHTSKDQSTFFVPSSELAHGPAVHNVHIRFNDGKEDRNSNKKNGIRRNTTARDSNYYWKLWTRFLLFVRWVFSRILLDRAEYALSAHSSSRSRFCWLLVVATKEKQNRYSPTIVFQIEYVINNMKYRLVCAHFHYEFFLFSSFDFIECFRLHTASRRWIDVFRRRKKKKYSFLQCR